MTHVPVFEDARGRLTLVSLEEIPFVATRAYVLDRIPAGGRRGGHASRTQNRLLVAISGHARLTLDDGTTKREVELRSGESVHVAPGVWQQIEAVDDHVSILVLADGRHDPSDRVVERPRA